MKKQLALILSIAILGSVLTGCASSENNNSVESSSNSEINMSENLPSLSTSEEMIDAMRLYRQKIKDGDILNKSDIEIIKCAVNGISDSIFGLDESRQFIIDYLNKFDNGVTVTAEETSKCVKEIERILAYASGSYDETEEISSSSQSSTVGTGAESSEQSSVLPEPDSSSAVSSEPAVIPVKKTKKVSEMLFNGELITDVAKRDLVSNYDYILDVAYVVDEKSPEIKIAIQVPIGTDNKTVKKAGDKAARYLASLANFSNPDFALPGSDDLGGLFEKYNLLLYIDDGFGGVKTYGAKVTISPVITW